MINSYISTNNIRFGTFRVALDLPFRDGYNRLRAAIFPTDLKEGVLLSLAGRVKNAVLGLVLCIPLINIIVDIAMRVLCLPSEREKIEHLHGQKIGSTGGGSGEGSAPLSKKELEALQLEEFFKSEPKYEKVIGRIAETLTHHFERVQEVDQEGETPAIFNQQITNLKDHGYNWKEIAWIIAQVGKLIVADEKSTLDKQKISYIYYRLHAERSLMALTESLRQKDYQPFAKMNRIVAPDDGNCFLWSCILGLEVLESHNPNERYQSLIVFKKGHQEYGALKVKQERLRETLVNGFLQAIGKNTEEGIEFKRKFCFYFLSTQSLKEKIELTDAEEGEIFASGIPNEAMLQSFVEGLATNGTWNGEFEAEIVSQNLQRPIVILNAADHTFRTIAGGQFLETNDPLIVEHAGNHFNTLFFA